MAVAPAMAQNDMRSKIMAIMMDKSLSEEEKGRKRQALLMGRWAQPVAEEPAAKKQDKAANGDSPKGASRRGPSRQNISAI